LVAEETGTAARLADRPLVVGAWLRPSGRINTRSSIETPGAALRCSCLPEVTTEDREC
jgi:hypothetical protein